MCLRSSKGVFGVEDRVVRYRARVCLGSSNRWFDIEQGCVWGRVTGGSTSKMGWMGPPRRVYGTSQKGRWDLPEGSMGSPRRVDGTSQKGRWDLPEMFMGVAGRAYFSLVKRRCLIRI